jgi:hypothetical protein
MKSSFEYWIDENVNQENAKLLFYEAIVCYKASAYRASLLISYTAFIDIIKRRLIQAKKPDTVEPGEWDRMKQQLLDEDDADKTIIKILNRSDKKYFNFSDSIRTQIVYWKDRRNDCAHLKTSKIDASHVETFWAFMQDNINKITVIGGEEELLNRIRRFFDENYTPLGSDYTFLIKEIPTSIEITNFNDFLSSVEIILTNAENENLFFIGDKAMFFYSMLNNLKGEYAELVRYYIYDNKNLSIDMFTSCPEYLKYFQHDKPQYVREMWKNNLNGYYKTKTVHTLLKNSIIPLKEIVDIITECVHNNKNNIPSEEDINFLIPYGYNKMVDDIIETSILRYGSYKWWVAENDKFIRYYITYNFKKKNTAFIDMLIKNYPNDFSDESLKSIYTILCKISDENDEYENILRERANVHNIDIDFFLLFGL